MFKSKRTVSGKNGKSGKEELDKAKNAPQTKS